MMTEEGSSKIVNFKTPGAEVLIGVSYLTTGAQSGTYDVVLKYIYIQYTVVK